MSEEIERRLEQSFRRDNATGGGPEIGELAHTITALFTFVAKRSAVAAGHPEWTAKDWLANQDCYQSATIEVCRTLIQGMPNSSHEQIDDTLSRLMSLLTIELHRKGEVEGGSGFFKPKDQQL